jgi:hypothetical protein
MIRARYREGLIHRRDAETPRKEIMYSDLSAPLR